MPSIIAHRGVPGERPENTLAGFALALEQGADGVELDVHATRDGVVVVHHDAVLAGTSERNAAISAVTWRALQELAPPSAPIPRLEDVLELVAGRVELHVEVKAQGIEGDLVPLLRRREQWCSVHSFDHRIAVHLAELLPGMRTGLLSCSYPLDAGALLRQAKARHFWQSETLIDEALVRRVHEAGGELIAWTVNSRHRAAELTAMGVDGLCTDRPGALRAELARGTGPA